MADVTIPADIRDLAVKQARGLNLTTEERDRILAVLDPKPVSVQDDVEHALAKAHGTWTFDQYGPAAVPDKVLAAFVLEALRERLVKDWKRYADQHCVRVDGQPGYFIVTGLVTEFLTSSLVGVVKP